MYFDQKHQGLEQTQLSVSKNSTRHEQEKPANTFLHSSNIHDIMSEISAVFCAFTVLKNVLVQILINGRVSILNALVSVCLSIIALSVCISVYHYAGFFRVSSCHDLYSIKIHKVVFHTADCFENVI